MDGGSTPGTEADRAAPLDALVAAVHEELAQLARGALRRERPGHTIDTAGLVGAAYLRLREQRAPWTEDRNAFLAAAAVAMRRVLVDHARARTAGKRGGDRRRLPLIEAEGLLAHDGRDLDVLALDEALDALAALDSRKARVVELRFFAGLDMAEVAATLDVPKRTVERDWTMARAWLRARLATVDPDEDA